MNEDDFDFWWDGPSDDPCYRWEDVELKFKDPDTGRFLRDKCLVRIRGAGPPRSYRPLEVAGLFLQFADLDGSPESVLGFVSRYGPLGNGCPSRAKGPWGDADPLRYLDLPDHPDISGHLAAAEALPGWQAEIAQMRHMANLRGVVEPLAGWQAEIAQMRHLTNLWGYATAGDEASLAEFVLWEGARVVFRWPAKRNYWNRLTSYARGSETWVPERYRTHDGTPLIERGDLIAPAKLYVTWQLDWVLSCVGGARACVVWSPPHDRPLLVNMPDTLLAALYLQFAAAVANPDGGFRIGRCRRCGKRIDFAPGVNRADRLTCSDSCRSLLYRRRKERARQLHAEGKKIKEIAEQLDIDMGRVKKWVANKKG